MSAHPTCSDGIAAIWFADDEPDTSYGLGPNTAPVSTNPGIIRGGASGNTTCNARPAAVTAMSVFRNGTNIDLRRHHAQASTPTVIGKCT
jgi:hypothetical protein